MNRYIVEELHEGKFYVLEDGTGKIEIGPFDDRRIAEDRAEKLNKEHERTKGKP
jgi:hypothetical protein